MTVEHKELVVRFYDELFGHGDLAVIDEFIGTEYIQHNPYAPDGAEALRGFVTGLRTAHPEMSHSIARVIAEDDLVLLHTHAVLDPGTPGQAVVDIFRVRDGRIVEHWDVIQPVPDATVNGNDMFTTLGTRDPSASTAESKRVASALFHAVIVDRDLTALDRYAADPFHQHNPQWPNGTAAAKEMFASTFASNPELSISVKRVIAEGDQVAFHHHFKASATDRGYAVIDVFRVQDGKVVEHWDVIQPVPESSANNNTMF